MNLPSLTDDEAFLFAATVNLYLEGLRRFSGRGLLDLSDIRIIFDMVEHHTNHQDPTAPAVVSRELTQEERDRVLNLVPALVPER